MGGRLLRSRHLFGSIALHVLFLPSKLPPLSGARDKRRLGIGVPCLRSHRLAFPCPVETLLSTVAHAAALLFSKASTTSTISPISQSRDLARIRAAENVTKMGRIAPLSRGVESFARDWFALIAGGRKTGQLRVIFSLEEVINSAQTPSSCASRMGTFRGY
jgi:hypothetical protein